MNSKAVLRRIRNFIAGQVVGLTRDEALLEEVLKCTYCRVYFERNGEASSIQALIDPEAIAKQYRQAFAKIRKEFATLFDADVEILLAGCNGGFVVRP